MAGSSSSTQNQPALPGPEPPSTASRRLPPPCWSHEETVALINAYCEKWYSLRRGNLRANHWQEVADSVAAHCPLSAGNPPKTSVQCRHKMEKLRKRYRAEVQRAVATPNGHRYCSSWVHFKSMDSMEKGPLSTIRVESGQIEGDEDEEDDEDQDYQEDLYPVRVKNVAPNNRSLYAPVSNGTGGGSGFRIKIPGRSGMVRPGVKTYSKFDEIRNPNPNYGSTKVLRDGHMGRFGMGKSGGGGGGSDGDDRMGKKREGDPWVDLLAAIKALGDGFVRMERMKMEMVREVEAMRMEMEMKRTEMILETQQRIVEVFAKGYFDRKNKKAKRMPTPDV